MIQLIIKLIIQLTILTKTIYSDSYEFRSSINGDILLTCNKTCVKIQYIDDTLDCVYPTSKLTNNKEIKDVKMICSYEPNCDFQDSCRYHTYNYKLFDYYCRNKNSQSELNICNGLGLGKFNNKIHRCHTSCAPFNRLSLDSGILKDDVQDQHVFLHIVLEPNNKSELNNKEINKRKNESNLILSKKQLSRHQINHHEILTKDKLKNKTKYNSIVFNIPEICFIIIIIIFIIILKIILIYEIRT